MRRVSIVRFALLIVWRDKSEKGTQFSFSLLDSLIFPCRSPLLLPVYSLVDVSILHTTRKFCDAKDLQHALEIPTSTSSYASSTGMAGSIFRRKCVAYGKKKQRKEKGKQPSGLFGGHLGEAI